MAETILKRVRRSSGMRQIDVARLLGISQQAYAYFENGQRPVPEKHKPRLVSLLRLDPRQL